MKHIVEHEGVLLELTYEVGSDDLPEFQEIRALGEDYKPTGPNLLPVFDSSLVLVSPGNADHLMNILAKELPHAA